MENNNSHIKNIIIVLAIIAVIVAVVVSKIQIEETKDTMNNRITHYADSVSAVMLSDSLHYEHQLHVLDSEIYAYKHIAESLSTSIAVNQKSNKQYVRTIYKDSIKEVYVENNELVMQYEQQIKKLEDSLAIEKIITVHDTVVVDGTQTEKTIVHTTQVYDTIHVESHSTKNVTAADPRFTLFVEGNVDIMDDVEIHGLAGGKMRLLGPLYGKAALKYDGSLGGELGIGAEIRF